MGYVIGIAVWTAIVAVVGFLVAGANPKPAAKWDEWRRRILRVRQW